MALPADEGPKSGWRRAVLGALGTALFFTGCHYVDPQCLTPGFGIGARREHGVLFQLGLNVPHKRHTHAISLIVDRAGGVEYTDVDGAISTCRRVSDEENEGLATLWTSDALQRSLPQCGSGSAYVHYRDGACRESRRKLIARRLASLPYAGMVYYTEDRPVSFSWDLESELPEELEEAFTSTLGLLCGGTTRLARHLRRSLPELAARAGC